MPLDLSIVIVTLNAANQLRECLDRLAKQNLEPEVFEILVVDGGSTDSTQEIAEAAGAKFIDGGYKNNQEARRYVGAMRASGKIVGFIDADNWVVEPGFLESMLAAFSDGGADCAFTKWYSVCSTLGYLDNYYALMGGNDPIAFYLGKNDRVPLGVKRLPSGASLVKASKKVEYVNFDVSNLPVVGCNGFFIRRDLLNSLELKSPEYFFHTDIHVDLLQKNPNLVYAIVKEPLVHATGGTIWKNFRKRLAYQQEHSLSLAGMRRYKVFDPSNTIDQIKLFFAAIFCFTLVEPTARALVMSVKTRRVEWLAHPIICFGLASAYMTSVIRRFNLR